MATDGEHGPLTKIRIDRDRLLARHPHPIEVRTDGADPLWCGAVTINGVTCIRSEGASAWVETRGKIYPVKPDDDFAYPGAPDSSRAETVPEGRPSGKTAPKGSGGRFGGDF